MNFISYLHTLIGCLFLVILLVYLTIFYSESISSLSEKNLSRLTRPKRKAFALSCMPRRPKKIASVFKREESALLSIELLSESESDSTKFPSSPPFPLG